ncbi:uncharacterized protein LOC121407919 [Lytechinus variegatus]|uniref:uncharacterized protein LOC121407919 n=1 Tax=Lytechinus variegatus TaxID=7654 RepID=UPI001BB24CE5|nr:uncharacterized protein LOC121407919 [Lytechinus variegatus]
MAEFSQVFEDGLRARNVFVADQYNDDDGPKQDFKGEEEKYAFTDESGPEEDPSLPYAGKVYLARRKKPDTWLTTMMEILAVVLVACFIYYSYYYMDNLQFHVTHAYAHMGQAHAAHMVGQRLLWGEGTKQDEDKAMEWFRVAADKGHPHASHNLAIGHLHGYKTDVKSKEEARNLLEFARDNGVHEAHDALHRLCPHDQC